MTIVTASIIQGQAGQTIGRGIRKPKSETKPSGPKKHKPNTDQEPIRSENQSDLKAGPILEL